MLDDRQAESRAADLLGVALVHAVETFKNTLAVCLRNADAGIRDREDRLLLGAADLHMYRALLHIIFDRVVTEIVEHFLHNDRHALHRGGFALQRDRDLPCFGSGAQLLQYIFRDLVEIKREHLLGEALVIQAGQTDNILDQCDHACGLVADAQGKPADVLFLDHAAFHHVGNAVDRSQRGFQLMGDVCGEFPPQGIALFTLGDVQQHHDRAGHAVFPCDRVCDQLHGGILDRQDGRGSRACERLSDHAPERLCIAEIEYRENLLTDFALFAEQLQCRMVMRKHSARRTDQQQALLHIVGQNAKLLLLTGQLVHLRVDLRFQTADLPGQRPELRIFRQRRAGIQPQLFQLQRSIFGKFIADKIKRHQHQQPDQHGERQQLKHEPEIVFGRQQQRINQQAEAERGAHCDQQLAEQCLFHSVASVESVGFAWKRYPTPRTVSTALPASPSFARSVRI